MKFSEIVLKTDEASVEEYLEWTTEMESKTRQGRKRTKYPVSCSKELIL